MSPVLWSDPAVQPAVQVLIWVAIIGLFWMIMIRPARNRQRKVAQVQRQISIGDDVMLSAGIFGVVRSLDDAHVQVEIAPGTTIKVVRQAVLERVAESNEGSGEGPDESPAEPLTDERRGEESE
jgi:preprotein translocase subunit YajC